MIKTIFIVEDEKNIRDMIEVYLTTKKYKILKAGDYDEALKIINSRKNIDLVLLDWMIPKGDGLNLITQIKKNPRRHKVPIIILSAKVKVDDRIKGLNVGADDYLTKPFMFRELLARIEAHLRRTSFDTTQRGEEKILEYGGIRIDTLSQRVIINEQYIYVRRIEFKLLQFLVKHPDRVLSRIELLDNVWGMHTFVAERTVDVSIGRLKKILAQTGHDKLLQTVRGEGYRLSVIAM